MSMKQLWTRMLCTGAVIAVTAVSAHAQTNPSPRAVPFSENFGSVGSTTAPLGFAAWSGLSGASVNTQTAAEASVPTADATISTANPALNGSGAAFYRSPDGNARLSILQSSNAANGVNQWVLAINTAGQSNLVLTYDIAANVNSGTRWAGVVAQYRVGNTGVWTTLSGSVYQAGSSTCDPAVPAATLTLPLPSDTWNQPEVQIRWANWRPANVTGCISGSSSGFDIDNVSVATGSSDPTGACCLASGGCTITTAANCASQGGTYQGNDVSCQDANCPVPTGACCVGTFCQVTTAAECAAFSGVFTAGVGCDPSPCVEPEGACCLADGTCVIATATNCAAQGGVYAGDTTTCENRACTFACCFTDGTCQLLTVNACGTAGGTVNTARTTCSPNQCPQPPSLGACCVGTNCTANLTWSDCIAQNGIWLGKGSVCTPTLCEQASAPNLVALYDFDVNRQATSFTITTTGVPPFPLGDAFGVVQRFRLSPEPEPFALLDDTVNLFAGDTIGVISEARVDSLFGVVDIFGVIEPDAANQAVAEWTFNIAGRSNLAVSADIAAMGDFEATGAAADRFIFEVSIDGGPFTVVFDGQAAEAIDNFEYTMAGGQVRTLNDPLRDQITELVIDNVFRTFNWTVAGTGNVLTLRFRAMCDGAEEVFAFDNIRVTADPIGAPTGACCTGNGCVIASESLCTGVLAGTYEGDATVCTPDPCAAAPCPGDYNGNRTVDLLDLLAFNADWSSNLGQTVTPGSAGDYNGNGTVDLLDLLAFNADWSSNLGQTCP